MKNSKKIIIIILLITICTGCFKRDDMEDINIITTVYPLEYVLTKLYGENSIINSIYPDGVNINEYKISSKEYNNFIKQDLFVYNGLSNDKEIARTLINKNKDLLIMDSNLGMEYEYGLEELWLNPSNLLMISQNIKNGLKEFIDNKYIKNEIEEAYSELKMEISELDAAIKLLSEQANTKTLIIASPSLQFLSKYGFKTILINDETSNEKNIVEAISLIKNKDVNYIYILENDKESKVLEQIRKETKAELLTIDKIDNINDEERDNKKNYVSLMNDNIELLRKGTE